MLSPLYFIVSTVVSVALSLLGILLAWSLATSVWKKGRHTNVKSVLNEFKLNAERTANMARPQQRTEVVPVTGPDEPKPHPE